jgi:hypothetical protein
VSSVPVGAAQPVDASASLREIVFQSVTSS